jgi:hypothetical protein
VVTCRRWETVSYLSNVFIKKLIRFYFMKNVFQSLLGEELRRLGLGKKALHL